MSQLMPQVSLLGFQQWAELSVIAICEASCSHFARVFAVFYSTDVAHVQPRIDLAIDHMNRSVCAMHCASKTHLRR